MRPCISAIAFVAALVCGPSTDTDSLRAQVSTIRYEVIDIGGLTEMPYSVGSSVSNSGFLAGNGSNGVDFQAGFIWRQDIGIRWLKRFSGAGESFVGAVNNAGQVLGTAFGPETRGVLWNANGSVLNVFESAEIDQPTGLNNAGLVTGYRNTHNSQTAYVWNGSYADLGFPAPAKSSQGSAINDAGQVAGHLNGGQAFDVFGDVPAVFLWSSEGGFSTILTSSSFTHVDVRDLSNTGAIVGVGYSNGGINSAAWKWDVGNGFVPLISLPSETLTMALAVNDSGIIVGRSGQFGTIWDEAGIILKADDLLVPAFADWRILSLRGINDDGWLTGDAFPPGSTNSRAVLLRPVPEPAAIALLLMGSGSLLVWQRIRKHSLTR